MKVKHPKIARQPSRRYGPFKLLVLIVWGQYSTSMEWAGVTCRLNHGPIARLMGISNFKVREYLEDLETKGYLTALLTDRGFSTFQVKAPPRRNNDLDPNHPSARDVRP